MAEDEFDVFDEVKEGAEEATTEAEKGEIETEVDAEAETETQEESPSSEDIDESQAGKVATIVAERQRRQEAERERDELKAQLGKQEKVEVPDPITDPKGFSRHQDNQLFGQKLDMSEELFEETHSDYGAKKAAFTELVSEVVDGAAVVKDEALYKRFRASRNPAKFIHVHMSKQEKLSEVSEDDYESKQEAKYRAKFIQEAKDAGVSAADLPDLTNATATNSNTDPSVGDTNDGWDVWDEEK